MQNKIPLPIDSILDEFSRSFAHVKNFIIQASPGSGKSTRLAPSIIQMNLLPPGKKILMLQPRRIAAKAVAMRIADENSWELGGDKIGYQVRFEKKSTDKTQLVVMTEGLLSRYMINDPELKNVGCVILDEFHERSVHSDLALSLLKELQSAYRPDLKIIVMSATLETSKLRSYLEAPKQFDVEAKIYPLHTIYQPKKDKRQFSKSLEQEVLQALQFLLSDQNDDGGSVLVFLPGVSDIRKVKESLGHLYKSFDICELHSSLSLAEQTKALALGDKRRIILSTNIAETSLTVPGVSAVVDSGHVKVANWNPSTLAQSLELKRISLASATQRAGRACRTQAGRVYKLWAKDDEYVFKNYEVPEIHRCDLSSVLLTLAMWGVRDFHQFSWFEAPEKSKIDRSLFYLCSLGALDENLKITVLGKKIQKIPLEPHLASMLIMAAEKGSLEKAALSVALLVERDPTAKGFQNLFHRECDLESRLQVLETFRDTKAKNLGLNEFLASKIIKLASDLEKIVSDLVKVENYPQISLIELLFSAFSFRLSRRKAPTSNKCLMVGGRGAYLDQASLVESAEYFLALDLVDASQSAETRILKASSISKGELFSFAGNKITEKVVAQIDLKELTLKFLKGKYFYDLLLEGPFAVSEQEAQGDLEPMIESAVLTGWGDLLDRYTELREFETRVLFYNKYFAASPIEELSASFKTSLVSSAIEFLKHHSMSDLKWNDFIPLYYPQDSLTLLDKFAPSKILVPSGREIKLSYDSNLGIVKCPVKLQELFGLGQSPVILNGYVKITFELLSPAQRPVQVTQDLKSFWENTYPELRKELKIRYPKHPWPEDPWSAQATHKTLKKR